MNIHKNARLTVHGRAEAVRRVTQREVGPPGRARPADHRSGPSVSGWLGLAAKGCTIVLAPSCPSARHPAGRGIGSRSCASGSRRTCEEIAAAVAVSRATVARIVARCGWSRLHVLELPPTSRRYERAVVGELLHLDTKKLGRIVRPESSGDWRPAGHREGAGGSSATWR